MGELHSVPEATDADPVGWWRVVVFALAACVFAFGAWTAWSWRLEKQSVGGWVRRWRDGLSPASRYAVGLALMALAYHGASYVSPAHWLPLRVPPERWFVVVIGAALLIGGSLAIDRRAERI